MSRSVFQVARVGDYRAKQGEIAIAERLIETHGAVVIAEALPKAVKILKSKWPDCKTFKGVESYIDDALRPFREQQRHEKTRRHEEDKRQEEIRQQDEERRRERELQPMWLGLTPAEQEEIRASALKGHPVDVLDRRPKLAHSLCLVELARRRNAKTEGGQ